jgi:hypothetical protein
MSESDMTTRYKLAYAESVRGLEMQSSSLNELRARIGLVLSAASISSAFLGAAALARHHHHLAGLSAYGVVLFGVTVALSLAVLLPLPGWAFVSNGRALAAFYADREDEGLDVTYRQLAESNGDSQLSNSKRIGRLYVAFACACVVLGADVIVWLCDLGTRR